MNELWAGINEDTAGNPIKSVECVLLKKNEDAIMSWSLSSIFNKTSQIGRGE